MVRPVLLLAAWLMLWPGLGAAQQARPKPPVPQPFPKPQATDQAKPGQPQAPPGTPAEPPTDAAMGVPIYPTAEFLASYDAGRGQRYYLFGCISPFQEIVAYYKSVLKERGDLVFEEPPTYMFEVGRFREDEMAFPPGVTVKDYSWGGLNGYPNPKPGGKPERFPTIIQIVPVAGSAPSDTAR